MQLGRYTTKTHSYPHYGMAAYRIEIDISEPLRPLQRHIWTRADGSVDEEAWIATIRTSPDKLIATGYSLVE